MTCPASIPAARIRLGEMDFYIPTWQIRGCTLVNGEMAEVPRFSEWLGLAEEAHSGLHLHLMIPASRVESGWTLWGELENVSLPKEHIFPLPPMVARTCRIPALKALVGPQGFSPLLCWEE